MWRIRIKDGDIILHEEYVKNYNYALHRKEILLADHWLAEAEIEYIKD